MTTPPIDLHAIRRDPHYKRFKAAMRRIARTELQRIRAALGWTPEVDAALDALAQALAVDCAEEAA